MRTSIYRAAVQFGDLVGMVFYPNFYRWFDAATRQLFGEAGLGWRQLREQHGAVGIPVIETGAVRKRQTYCRGRIETESSVAGYGRKTLLVRRDGVLLAKGGFKVRILGAPHPDDSKRLMVLKITGGIRNALA